MDRIVNLGAATAGGLKAQADLDSLDRLNRHDGLRDPAVEARIRETGYSGALPSGAPPFAGVVLNNAAAGKLDYYLRRSLTYARTGCGPTRDVVATIDLTNTAPATGLPPYVTDRLDSIFDGRELDEALARLVP